MLQWIPGLLILLGFVGLLVFGCVRSVLQIRAVIVPRTSRSRQPECGQCGYIVRGLTKLVCPECGAHLLEVGIVGSRGVEQRARVIGQGIAGVVLLAVVGAALSLFVVVPLDWSPWIMLWTFGVLTVGGIAAMLAARRRFRNRRNSSPPPAPPFPDH